MVVLVDIVFSFRYTHSKQPLWMHWVTLTRHTKIWACSCFQGPIEAAFKAMDFFSFCKIP